MDDGVALSATPADSHAAAAAAARGAYGKLVAFLAARTHDVAGAEDALSEAFAEALVSWPRDGVPRVPEAWLLTVARRRMIDAGRRRRVAEGAAAELQLLAEIDATGADEPPPEIPDERLKLLFVCAHPAIDAAVRAPLMLQVVLGFDAATIASAFLVSPAAMSQRLVRAKARIAHAGIGFAVPPGEALAERLEAVLDAIYAAYAEGWADPQGTDARRRNLAEEALWLGRLLVALLPGEPEALGLLALMLHTHARRAARRDAGGEFVPLDEQDIAQWDSAMIDEAERLLHQARRAGAIGRFQLEAAVQSAHAARHYAGAADWPAIEQLYAGLCALTGSPVAALNRALAIGRCHGPAAALEALEAIEGAARLADYQPYWAARAELLAQSGRPAEADAAYERAIGLESDAAVRRFLQRRRSRAMLAAAPTPPGPEPR